jgi:hypothetical protein
VTLLILFFFYSSILIFLPQKELSFLLTAKGVEREEMKESKEKKREKRRKEGQVNKRILSDLIEGLVITSIRLLNIVYFLSFHSTFFFSFFFLFLLLLFFLFPEL